MWGTVLDEMTFSIYGIPELEVDFQYKKKGHPAQIEMLLLLLGTRFTQEY
jgi:hypothetical protein